MFQAIAKTILPNIERQARITISKLQGAAKLSGPVKQALHQPKQPQNYIHVGFPRKPIQYYPQHC